MPKTRDPSAGIKTALQALEYIINAAIGDARQLGRDEALAQVRDIMGGGAVAVRRGPGRPMGSKNKPKQKRKNSWEGLSPADRLKRVNAIRKGKGLQPKSA